MRYYNNGPLPDFLFDQAYFPTGLREFALCKKDALRYFLWCREQGHTVYGWEVWVPTIPGPTALIMHCEGDSEESYSILADANFSEQVEKYEMDVVINPTVEEYKNL